MRDWLAARAGATPDATALVDAASGERRTFGVLDADVGRTAGRLAAGGVGAGDHLGIVAGPRRAAVDAVFAAARLGAVPVPISARLTAREIQRHARRADLDAVVCGADTEATVAAAVDLPLVSVDDPTHGATALADIDPVAVAPHDAAPEAVRAIVFTSGTTGAPKPVGLTGRNLLFGSVASAFRLGLDPDDRWYVALSLHHVGGLVQILRMALYGTTVVLSESFEPGPAVDDLDTHGATGVSLVPTMLRRMLDRRGTLPESVRAVLLGGAPASPSLIERCQHYSIPVYPTYGTTETASQIATARPAEAYAHPESAGRPLLWTDVSVRDDDGGTLPAGEVGELVVSGPTVAPGYYGEAGDGTAFGPAGFWTGDAGYVDGEGRVHVLGRTDDRIISGGETVRPAEVISVLEGHPDVAAAAVVGLADDEWGERVAALVVPDGAGPSAADLEAHCRERLAGFKLPRTIHFADALPRTDSGTVDRDAARDCLRDDEAASGSSVAGSDDDAGGDGGSTTPDESG